MIFVLLFSARLVIITGCLSLFSLTYENYVKASDVISQPDFIRNATFICTNGQKVCPTYQNAGVDIGFQQSLIVLTSIIIFSIASLLFIVTAVKLKLAFSLQMVIEHIMIGSCIISFFVGPLIEAYFIDIVTPYTECPGVSIEEIGGEIYTIANGTSEVSRIVPVYPEKILGDVNRRMGEIQISVWYYYSVILAKLVVDTVTFIILRTVRDYENFAFDL
jgi:hypothetical protein